MRTEVKGQDAERERDLTTSLREEDYLSLTWSRLVFWDTMGTHSMTNRTRPDFTPSSGCHWE